MLIMTDTFLPRLPLTLFLDEEFAPTWAEKNQSNGESKVATDPVLLWYAFNLLCSTFFTNYVVSSPETRPIYHRPTIMVV